MAGLNLGKNFNQDISRWDLSDFTNMSSLFYNAATFNQNLGVWNVDHVNSLKTI
jgi:hypothetical protein